MAEQILIPATPSAAEPEGMVEMVLDVEKGRVLQQFQRPMQRVLYVPRNAIEVAERLADLAYEADGKIKPAEGALKTELIERHRRILITRVRNILHTARLDVKKTDQHLAERIVEIMLTEVF